MIQIIPTGGANQDGEKKEASGENIFSWQRDHFPAWRATYMVVHCNFGEGGITEEGTASRSTFWNAVFVFLSFRLWTCYVTVYIYIKEPVSRPPECLQIERIQKGPSVCLPYILACKTAESVKLTLHFFALVLFLLKWKASAKQSWTKTNFDQFGYLCWKVKSVKLLEKIR